jgi:hypothetical protein
VPAAIEIILRISAGLLGAWIVAAKFLSAVKLVVVPRGGSQRITRFAFIAVRSVVERLAHSGRPFDIRDRHLSLYAPLALVSLPIMWFTLSIIGFTGIHWAVVGGSIAQAIRVSGSSMLTLGVAFNQQYPDVIVSFLQAAMGIMLGALLISYLPSLYQSYQRRETLVGLLESRAGIPPSPFEMLVRYQRIGGIDLIEDDLFIQWEQWFAEVEESHTSFAALVFFRSPHPDRSWITAAGAVLDTASLSLAVVDRPFSARTALCLRTGFLCLCRIADYFGIPYDPDPEPTDPISVTRHEFDLMLVELEAGGLPLKSDREQAWRDFQGWRVNYDTALVAISKMIVAPEGRWSSNRPGQRMLPRLRRPKGIATAAPEKARERGRPDQTE